MIPLHNLNDNVNTYKVEMKGIFFNWNSPTNTKNFHGVSLLNL